MIWALGGLGWYRDSVGILLGMNVNVNVSDRARSIPPCAGRGKQEELKNKHLLCYHLY